MGRKKILGGSAQPAESCDIKPFCYYCDREFDSTKTLIQHQRTKHLACGECGLKFDTVTGLRVHMLNAYKKPLKEVPGAIPGRENPDIVVHGMEGIPKSIIEEKTKKILEERADKEKLDKARLEKERSERPTPPEPEAKESKKQKEEPIRSSSPVVDEKAKNRKTKADIVPDHALEKPSVPAPQAPAPAPPPPALAPTPAPVPESQPQSTVPQPLASMMPRISPGVQKLLLSASSSQDADSDMAVSVPALPGRTVPGKLSGLHPVALQVLAAAGVLSLGKGGFERAAQKRPAPGINPTSNEPLLGGVGSFPTLGFPPQTLNPLVAAFPAGSLNAAIGALGTQVAAGTLGFDTKRPRLDGPAMVLPVMP